MYYPVTIPWFVRKVLYPGYVWSMPATDRTIYLTFDDGPHPEVTPFVLDELRKFGAKASFFCIGKNVAAEPEVYASILREGHVTGNHSYHHLNGWKTNGDAYVQDVALAAAQIRSELYRPPYGKITRWQAGRIRSDLGLKVVMWSVLSGDFDTRLSREACLQHVTGAAKAGSIVVFHDSEKAFERMRYALPRVLEYFADRGFAFRSI